MPIRTCCFMVKVGFKLTRKLYGALSISIVADFRMEVNWVFTRPSVAITKPCWAEPGNEYNRATHFHPHVSLPSPRTLLSLQCTN